MPEITAEYSEDRIMNDKKKAVLVVSFGTSYEETRKKTIDQIENDMAEAFPSYAIYRAWTSGMIRAKLLKRDGIRIYNVCEALEAMAADGIQEEMCIRDSAKAVFQAAGVQLQTFAAVDQPVQDRIDVVGVAPVRVFPVAVRAVAHDVVEMAE